MLRRLTILVALAILSAGAPAAGAVGTPPTIDALAYIVVDPATGESLAERAPDRELPMASTTKIMTALVVLETADLGDRITVPAAAVAIGGSTGRLEEGERLTVRQLLTALLVPSGNDASVALAVGVAGSERAFVALMNRRAEQIGLTGTRFANPHGLDAPDHHSTVRDLVRLGREAMRDPLFRELVAARRASIPGPGGEGVREYESQNGLLDLDPGADGIKTGMTDGAGYALVGHSRRAGLGVQLYTAIIGSPSADRRAIDADRLLDHGFAQYARATLIAPDAIVGRAPVDDSPGADVPYRAQRGLSAPIRLGVPVTETIVAPTELRAPVSAGEVVGTITLRQGDHVLGRRDLLAARSASEPGIWDRFRAGVGALVP